LPVSLARIISAKSGRTSVDSVKLLSSRSVGSCVVRVTISANGLTGRGLLQSREEWAVRNHVLAQSLSQLAVRYLPDVTGRGLDVGCQSGDLTDYLNAYTSMSWEGIDPALSESAKSPQGASLHSAAADKIPYPDRHFDCLILANVFEHIPPARRHASLIEMYRVLRPGAILVGQLPNPYFPIESHSRLPFMGWLPVSLQKKYWKLSPVPWDHDFFTATIRHVRTEAQNAGFEIVQVNNFNYPPAALPKSARPVATIMSLPMKYFPWAWQFVIRRPAADA
jgi:SAM-dependent methyltransferase